MLRDAVVHLKIRTLASRHIQTFAIVCYSGCPSSRRTEVIMKNVRQNQPEVVDVFFPTLGEFLFVLCYFNVKINPKNRNVMFT